MYILIYYYLCNRSSRNIAAVRYSDGGGYPVTVYQIEIRRRTSQRIFRAQGIEFFRLSRVPLLPPGNRPLHRYARNPGRYPFTTTNPSFPPSSASEPPQILLHLTTIRMRVHTHIHTIHVYTIYTWPIARFRPPSPPPQGLSDEVLSRNCVVSASFRPVMNGPSRLTIIFMPSSLSLSRFLFLLLRHLSATPATSRSIHTVYAPSKCASPPIA